MRTRKPIAPLKLKRPIDRKRERERKGGRERGRGGERDTQKINLFGKQKCSTEKKENINKI